MPIIGALVNVILLVINAYQLVVIVSALITWVNPDPYNPIVRFLRAMTEPVFYRVRKLMPFVVVSGFDLTPVVVLLALYFLQQIIVGFSMSAMM